MTFHVKKDMHKSVGDNNVEMVNNKGSNSDKVALPFAMPPWTSLIMSVMNRLQSASCNGELNKERLIVPFCLRHLCSTSSIRHKSFLLWLIFALVKGSWIVKSILNRYPFEKCHRNENYESDRRCHCSFRHKKCEERKKTHYIFHQACLILKLGKGLSAETCY